MSFPPDTAARSLLPPIAVALLAGAAIGACEAAYQLGRAADPSVSRRIVPVMAYGTFLTAGAFLAVHAGGLLVLAGRRAPYVPGGRPRVSLVASWWIGAAMLALAVTRLAPRVVARQVPGRLVALVIALIASIVAGRIALFILDRRVMSRLVAGLSSLARPLPLVPVSLVALMAAWGIAFASAAVSVPASTSAVSPSEPGTSQRPNIVLIVADTLRADALGSYGGSSAETPVLDRLAREGVVFENVTAPSSWTLPSVVSIFTSLYPRRHGFTEFDGIVPEDLATLAELFRDAGYRCIGLVGNPLMAHSRGFDRGFETYDVYDYEIEARLSVARAISGLFRLSGLFRAADAEKHLLLWPDTARPPFITTRVSFYVHDEELNARMAYLAPDLGDPGSPESGKPDDRPVFLYVHYVSPHTPYLRHPLPRLKSQPALAAGNLERIRELYAGEVEYMDSVIGDLLGRLDEAGALENAIVAFTSDHGEEFLEHGRWEHGHSVFQEVIDVPLILSGAEVPAGRRVAARADLLDVAPTLLDLAGVAVPENASGRSLLEEMADGDAGGEGTASHPVFAELTSRYLNPKIDYHAVLIDRWKLVRRRNPSGRLLEEDLYDLRSDAGEARPLGGPSSAGMRDALAAHLDQFERDPARGATRDLSEVEMRRLRALGYLE